MEISPVQSRALNQGLAQTAFAIGELYCCFALSSVAVVSSGELLHAKSCVRELYAVDGYGMSPSTTLSFYMPM